MRLFAKLVLALGLLLPISARAAAPFLQFPLVCGSTNAKGNCLFVYSQGAYTPQAINTVLDHSMKKNPNNYWQYGTTASSSQGGDGVIVAFNGDRVNGPAQGTSALTIICIKGTILLKPTPTSAASLAMVNGSGCNGAGAYNYTSYDEHPGYDYKADYRTPVRAAASGWVIDNGSGHQLCILTNIGKCSDWGYVGIDHRNGYITQYGHLSSIIVKAGAWVGIGTTIGYSGHTAPVALADHLHFEVLALIPGAKADFTNALNYAVVDPYGWVGVGTDPLYSVGLKIAPAKLWN